MTVMTKIGGAALAAALFVANATAGQLTVETNTTKPLRLNSPASSIVVGNKNIADVAVHDGQLLFVTGKTFGTTNLMVFNESGRQIYSSTIVVTANTASLVNVNRAGDSFTYDCTPDCRRTIAIGDHPGYFDTVMEQNERLSELNSGD